MLLNIDRLHVQTQNESYFLILFFDSYCLVLLHSPVVHYQFCTYIFCSGTFFQKSMVLINSGYIHQYIFNLFYVFDGLGYPKHFWYDC